MSYKGPWDPHNSSGRFGDPVDLNLHFSLLFRQFGPARFAHAAGVRISSAEHREKTTTSPLDPASRLPGFSGSRAHEPCTRGRGQFSEELLRAFRGAEGCDKVVARYILR